MEVPIKKQTILDLLPTLQNDHAFEIEVIRTLLKQLPAVYREELVRTEFLRVCKEPYYILHTPYEGDKLFFTKDSLLEWCARNVDPQVNKRVYEDWIFRGLPSRNRLVSCLTVDYYNPLVQAFGNVHQRSRVANSIKSGAMTIHTSGNSADSSLLVPVQSEDAAINWYEKQIDKRLQELATVPPATNKKEIEKRSKEIEALKRGKRPNNFKPRKEESHEDMIARRKEAVKQAKLYSSSDKNESP